MDAYKRTEQLFDRAKKLGLIQHSTGDGAPTVEMVTEMLMETESDFRQDLAYAALVKEETRDEYLRMEEALEGIAIKKLSREMSAYEKLDDDYRSDYDDAVNTARAALPKKGES